MAMNKVTQVPNVIPPEALLESVLVLVDESVDFLPVLQAALKSFVLQA